MCGILPLSATPRYHTKHYQSCVLQTIAFSHPYVQSKQVKVGTGLAPVALVPKCSTHSRGKSSFITSCARGTRLSQDCHIDCLVVASRRVTDLPQRSRFLLLDVYEEKIVLWVQQDTSARLSLAANLLHQDSRRAVKGIPLKYVSRRLKMPEEDVDNNIPKENVNDNIPRTSLLLASVRHGNLLHQLSRRAVKGNPLKYVSRRKRGRQ